jgi:hypothetical protein
MTPQRHLISDISFAGGWITCSCRKKIKVYRGDSDVDGGTAANQRLADAYSLHQRQVREGTA